MCGYRSIYGNSVSHCTCRLDCRCNWRPHDVVVPIETVIFRYIGLRGGVSPVRRYIPELLEDVLEGTIHPGLVFDFTTDLNGITEAYVVMDERRAMKSLVQVGTI